MANCISCGRQLPFVPFGERSNVCSGCRAAAIDAPGAPSGENAIRAALLRKRAPITTALVGLNVAVFLAMAASGASLSEPGTRQLLRWGANYGPLSLGGQSWRMLASNYVHIGFLHILFNMWCLWDLGNLAERIFDGWTYVLVYTACGIAGSISSLWWHPLVVGAGASGAIFGLAGALIAALYLGHLPIPARAVRHSLRSLVIFALYNLGFGAIGSRIDNSAHVGGLLTGLALGGILAGHLMKPVEARRGWSYAVFAVTAVALLGSYQWVRRANAYVIPLEKGAAALQQNQLDEAIRNLESSAAAKPHDPAILSLLGSAYLHKRDYPNAQRVLEHAAAIDGNDPEVQYDLGFALLRQGKSAEAIPPLEHAARLDPQNAGVLQALAQAYLAQNRPADAQAAMTKAIEIAKRQPKK
jgi:rhomboid protease GluP